MKNFLKSKVWLALLAGTVFGFVVLMLVVVSAILLASFCSNETCWENFKKGAVLMGILGGYLGQMFGTGYALKKLQFIRPYLSSLLTGGILLIPMMYAIFTLLSGPLNFPLACNYYNGVTFCGGNSTGTKITFALFNFAPLFLLVTYAAALYYLNKLLTRAKQS